MLAALCVVLASVAPWAASANAAGAAPAEPAQVYVPIEDPVVEPAPRIAVKTPAEPSGPAVLRAARALGDGARTAAKVPFVELPGTAVPVWWALLMLLAVPLARVWRAWTARMFA